MDPAFPIERQISVDASPVVLVNIFTLSKDDEAAFLEAWFRDQPIMIPTTFRLKPPPLPAHLQDRSGPHLCRGGDVCKHPPRLCRRLETFFGMVSAPECFASPDPQVVGLYITACASGTAERGEAPFGDRPQLGTSGITHPSACSTISTRKFNFRLSWRSDQRAGNIDDVVTRGRRIPCVPGPSPCEARN